MRAAPGEVGDGGPLAHDDPAVDAGLSVSRVGGKAQAAAQEYIAAKYAQQYSRAFGTQEQASAAQNRMNAAMKQLEILGVKLPSSNLDDLKAELVENNKLVQKLFDETVAGIKIKDAK